MRSRPPLQLSEHFIVVAFLSLGTFGRVLLMGDRQQWDHTYWCSLAASPMRARVNDPPEERQLLQQKPEEVVERAVAMFSRCHAKVCALCTLVYALES